MVTVLFVDDEPDVLAGLRSSLRRLRKTYRFLFAVGAEEAMAVMDREPIDLIVTDMRMPGINGVELLQRVRADHPEVIRYVLSGEAEQELVIKAVPVAHRWLTKPCDRDVLTAALADAATHRELLADPEIRTAVAGAASLPTPPRLYAELLDLLADGEVSIARVGELIESDPAIAAKILQWANSAFSGGHQVNDLRAAIVLVGLSAVSQMVLLTEVFSEAGSTAGSTDDIAGFDTEVLRAYVVRTGEFAAGLAGPESAALARLGGLFSSIGLLLEARYLPERLCRAYQHALSDNLTLVEAERSLCGVSYPELGGHLLSVWGLPSELVLVVAASHRLPSPTTDPPFGPVEAVQAARLIAQRRLDVDRFPGKKVAGKKVAGKKVDGRVGSPHLDRPCPELDAAVSRWEAALTESIGS